MQVDDFLARLDGVRKTARGWMAKCPGHEDKSPSLTVAQGDDGRILAKCWSGCGIDQVVGALGLELSDLFPERPKQDHVPGLSRAFPAGDVLEALANQAFYVAYMAGTMAQGYVLEERDRAILWQAFDLIMEARRLALGERR